MQQSFAQAAWDEAHSLYNLTWRPQLGGTLQAPACLNHLAPQWCQAGGPAGTKNVTSSILLKAGVRTDGKHRVAWTHTSFVLPEGPSPLPTVCHSPSFCRQRHHPGPASGNSCIAVMFKPLCAELNVPMQTSHNCALPLGMTC